MSKEEVKVRVRRRRGTTRRSESDGTSAEAPPILPVFFAPKLPTTSKQDSLFGALIGLGLLSLICIGGFLSGLSTPSSDPLYADQATQKPATNQGLDEEEFKKLKSDTRAVKKQYHQMAKENPIGAAWYLAGEKDRVVNQYNVDQMNEKQWNFFIGEAKEDGGIFKFLR